MKMKEIKAAAPTPQDWIDLVRENERLAKRLELTESLIDLAGMSGLYEHELRQLENKTND